MINTLSLDVKSLAFGHGTTTFDGFLQKPILFARSEKKGEV